MEQTRHFFLHPYSTFFFRMLPHTKIWLRKMRRVFALLGHHQERMNSNQKTSGFKMLNFKNKQENSRSGFSGGYKTHLKRLYELTLQKNSSLLQNLYPPLS